MAIGGGPYLGLMPIRFGGTGIPTSKLFDERRLRPTLNDGSDGGGIIRLRPDLLASGLTEP